MTNDCKAAICPKCGGVEYAAYYAKHPITQKAIDGKVDSYKKNGYIEQMVSTGFIKDNWGHKVGCDHVTEPPAPPIHNVFLERYSNGHGSTFSDSDF